MRKIIIFLLAAVLGLGAYAQRVNTAGRSVKPGTFASKQVDRSGAKDLPTWQMINAPFTATDINGNLVNVGDTLASGKAVLVCYDATWNSWGWLMHQNGVLRAVYNNLRDSVCVIWVEADASTSTSEITSTGSSNSQGDWTNGGTVPYTIIDCSSCVSMVEDVWAYPDIYFVAPSGYYTAMYGTDWGFGPTDSAAAVASVRYILSQAPHANQLPLVDIVSVSSVLVGTSVTFMANIASVDSVTAISWSFPSGTPATSTADSVTVTWNTVGNYTVTLSVTNTTGTTTVTKMIDVFSWNWGDTISYCGDDGLSSSVGVGGNGEIQWGIRVPASFMTGHNYLNLVRAYISSPGEYELLVYNPASGVDPATPIYQNTYNVTESDEWVDFPIYDILQLTTTNDLWVTFHTNGVNYPATYSEFCGDYNSSYVYYQDVWYYIQDLSSSLNCTWMIEAVTSTTAPALSVAIEGPTSLITGVSGSFTAMGPASASYSWSLQGATPSTATGQTVSASWANAGTYTVTLTATLGTQTATATHTLNVISCGVQQLPFTMGFEETDNLECWLNVDADGDGHAWMSNGTLGFSSIYHSGSGSILSASYINNIGALTPDNWLVTPKIHIPTEGATLTWWDYGLDQTYFAEYYSVQVSTTTAETTSFVSTVFNTTISSGQTWTQRTVDLSSYAGQDIYLAFRHYNCTDEYWLAIDDISIVEGGSTGDTTITWNWGDTISYCGNDELESSIGMSGTGDITWGIKIPAQYMTGRDYLVSAQAYIYTAGNYELLIYNPTSETSPSTPLFQYTYSVTTSDDWFTFQIPGGVALNDANDLWVVLHCNGVSYPASFSEFCGDYNSSYIYYNNEWYVIQDLAETLDPTWMIRAITSSTAPALTVAISGPSSTSAGTTVNFTAVGPSTANYSWTFQGATPATATGQTASTSWTTGGTYTVTLNASLGGQTAQATTTITVNDCGLVQQLPFTMGFESDESIDCWGNVDSDGDGYGWYGSEDLGFTGIGHSGENSMLSASYINNIGVLTPDNWLITPKINIPTGGATLTWWDYGVDQSYFHEYYSVQVSSTTSDPASFATTVFTTTITSAQEWTQRTVDLSAFAGQDIYIAFRHHNCTDEYWLAIDDISVTAGAPPITVSIDGPTHLTIGQPATFTAIGPVAGTYSWTLEGAQPASAVGSSVMAMWGNAGSYTVSVTCNYNGQSAQASLLVDVAEPDTTLTYSGDEFWANVNGGGAITWAVMFPPALLTGRELLTGAAAFIPEAGSYQLTLAQGGESYPETTLFQQTYTLTNNDTGAWHNFMLANPITLDQTENLWVIFHTDDVEAPIAVTEFSGDENSCLIDFDGVFYPVYLNTSDGSQVQVSWMIKAYTHFGSANMGEVTFECGGNGFGIVRPTGSADGNHCGETDQYVNGFLASYDFIPGQGCYLESLYVNGVDMMNSVTTLSSDNSTIHRLSFAVGTATSVQAVFMVEEGLYSIVGQANDPSMGIVEGGGGYQLGEQVTLTAVPFMGYRFVDWADGVSDNPRTIVVTGDAVYVANFEPTNGIGDADGHTVIVTTKGNSILVNGAAGQTVRIYDAIGRLLYREDEAVPELRFAVPATGVYLVQLGDGTVRRVVVKN